jgi:PAS domain-containing protein
MTSSAEHDSVSNPDFWAIFDVAPAPYLVLSADFVIAAVNNAYLQATSTQRDEILGRGIFVVFPDNPDDLHADGEINLRASLTRVLNNKILDVMPVQRYDVPNGGRPGTGFTIRY